MNRAVARRPVRAIADGDGEAASDRTRVLGGRTALPRLDLRISRWIVVAAIALGALLRLHGALVGGQVADVAAYRGHVELLRQGQSVYQSGQVYPYFPGWLAIEWLVWLASNAVHVEFWIFVRMLVVGADVLTCFALWWAGSRLLGPPRARLAAVVYALSPIAILISGYHGQFDALPTLLAVVAAGLLAAPSRAGFSGGLLGLAVAIKPPPAILGPVFLRAPTLGRRERATFAGAAVATFLALVLGLAGNQTVDAFANVLGYGGVADQGLAGVFRALWLWRTGSASLPGASAADLQGETRALALAAMALALALTWHRGIARSSAAAILAFLATYGGVSTQYLLWPVAWLLLSDLSVGWAILYGVGTAAGEIGFYRVFWPELILGSGATGGAGFAPLYLAGEVIALSAILATLAAAIGRPRGSVPAWFGAVGALSILVVVTSYPVLEQCLWLIGETIRFAP